MNNFLNTLWRVGNYITSMKISDIIDILIVTYLIYQAIVLIRKTKSKNVAKAVLLFVVVLWISDLMNLTMINFVLRKTMELGLIAVLILFQPELRRLMEKIGSRLSAGNRKISESDLESAVQQTVMACSDMAASRTGGLIIFERETKLTDIIATGTVIDAQVNAELLKNLFYDKAPLHDGAVIIKDGRIAAAGCVLPLTKSTNLSKDLGMRHRAGIGLSEESDAVVLIVSEETGAVSCAIDGMLKRHLSSISVDKILRTELIGDIKTENEDNSLYLRLRRFFTGQKQEEGNNE